MTPPLKHLALIPDGNRRWAKAHGLPVLEGHRRVMEKVFPTLITKAQELGLPYFTIWGFSTENWQRSQEEVSGLMSLFKLFFEQHGQKLKRDGVRLLFIGRRDNLDPELIEIINRWSELTKTNTKLNLTIAGNYGGRDEIVRAVNTILERGEYSEIGEATLAAHLDTSIFDLPDPDLIIRTSGEKRLSGFMSWQSAYSELYFSDKFMPDWTGDDLAAAVTDFTSRTRRYGK
jgi:undecaprenyl diphosphate synthase